MRINFLFLLILLSSMTFAQNIIVKPDFDNASVSIEVCFPNLAEGDMFQAEVSYESQLVALSKTSCEQPLVVEMPEDFLRWTPDHPFLYDLKVNVLRNNKPVDDAETQFAMRCIGVSRDDNGVNRFTLNHLPIFLFGMQRVNELDTVSIHENMVAEIVRVKALGFNMIQVNNSFEIDRLSTLCDSIGLIVWKYGESEVANCLAQVPNLCLNLPSCENIETYEKYASWLYQCVFDGISAAVFSSTIDCKFMDFDVKRLLYINRKISHALAE